MLVIHVAITLHLGIFCLFSFVFFVSIATNEYHFNIANDTINTKAPQHLNANCFLLQLKLIKQMFYKLFCFPIFWLWAHALTLTVTVNYEITVLYLNISRHQLEIWWSQIEFTGDAVAEPVNGYLRPLNRQLMPWNFQIQYSYLHSNVFMCIDVYCHIIDKMT